MSTSTTSEVLTPPLSITYNEIDSTFAASNRAFTALVKQCYDDHIHTDTGDVVRKRFRLTLVCFTSSSCLQRMSAYFCDEWAELIDYVWNKVLTPLKTRENAQLAVTLFGVPVQPIPDDECDPVQEKNVAFILDSETMKAPPDNTGTGTPPWVALQTCCSRICGRNGVRLTLVDALHHADGTQPLELQNNCNSHFLIPSNRYLPFTEMVQSSTADVYAYITKTFPIKPSRGKHAFYQQLRIRDATLAWDADDFQVMLFGNQVEEFPGPSNCKESDLIRIHRFAINYRAGVLNFQGVIALDKRFVSFIVIDGNVTVAANTRECVKFASSPQFSFDACVDGYFIRHLRELCRAREEATNPDLVRKAEVNVKEVPNVLGVNRNLCLYLNEIAREHARINLVAMVVGRGEMIHSSSQDDDDDDDSEKQQQHELGMAKFWWVLWDGSNCDAKRDLLSVAHIQSMPSLNCVGVEAADADGAAVAMEVDGDDDDDDDDVELQVDANPANEMEDVSSDDVSWTAGMSFTHSNVMGTAVKVLVHTEYIMGTQYYNDISVGHWIELVNVRVDAAHRRLVCDEQSTITNCVAYGDHRVQQRKRFVYYNVENNTHLITHISSVNPHHMYQSFTPVKSILACNESGCKYKIRGKCVKYFTPDDNEMQTFVLFIRDASDAVIDVIFEGQEAKRFLGGEDEGDDLENARQCMQYCLREENIMDVCIRSYKPKNHNLIAYKAFDTVLIQ